MNSFRLVILSSLLAIGLLSACASKRTTGLATPYEVLLQDSCSNPEWIQKFNASGNLSGFQRMSRSEHRWSFKMNCSTRQQNRLLSKMKVDPCVLYVQTLSDTLRPATNESNQKHIKSKPIRNQ